MQVVARWLREMGTQKSQSGSHSAQRTMGKPPKKDSNQMSISLEASKSWAQGGSSSNSQQHQYQQRGFSTNSSAMSVDDDHGSHRSSAHSKGIANGRPGGGVSRGSVRESVHEDEEDYDEDFHDFEEAAAGPPQHNRNHHSNYDYKEDGKHSGESRYRK